MIRKDLVQNYIRDSEKSSSSSEVHAYLNQQGENVSLITVKRVLADLESQDLIQTIGAGRSTAYQITTKGRLMSEVDLSMYSSLDPEQRKGMRTFNFDLFKGVAFDPFSSEEKSKLDEATQVYRGRISDVSTTIHEKELERFVIELSWKSSRIEGNTYTLLDTERLIKEGIRSDKNTPDEARMILNHKDAFKYIYDNKEKFALLNRACIEDVHSILVKDLSVTTGLRSKPVGVTGSLYVPLDNQFQIKEATESLCQTVSRMPHGYAQALMAILGLSYIQPFEDGNKRTSRLIGNALLISHGYAPLSYRGVDENTYREAVLAFYEVNSCIPFKHIFIGQYDFAARNYLI